MAFSDDWTDDQRSSLESDAEDRAITVMAKTGVPGSGRFGGVDDACRRDGMPRDTPRLDQLMQSTEVRMVDKDTGGEKGQKLARFDLLPTDPLRQLAEHYGKGAQKYAERNWERGYNWSLSYAALQRHANAFWNGEDFDNGVGGSSSHHMIAVAWHALALVEFARTHPEKDDRA